MATTTSYFWYSGHWVKFTLTIGYYQNVIEFLTKNKLSFLGSMSLDFNDIPLKFHGAGYSYNLYSYIANNESDYNLINQFLNYFMVTITKFKYITGENMEFIIYSANDWQHSYIYINPYVPVTTTTTYPVTTTTTTFPITTTTTTFLGEPEFFSLFGDVYTI